MAVIVVLDAELAVWTLNLHSAFPVMISGRVLRMRLQQPTGPIHGPVLQAHSNQRVHTAQHVDSRRHQRPPKPATITAAGSAPLGALHPCGPRWQMTSEVPTLAVPDRLPAAQTAARTPASTPARSEGGQRRGTVPTGGAAHPAGQRRALSASCPHELCCPSRM